MKIVNAGAGSLVPMMAERQFAGLGTPHQYLVQRRASRTKSLLFCAANTAQNFYFHGSNLENWHQIISQGLESKSASTMQLNGAAHGKGVYVANKTWLSKLFCGETQLRVMGVVEVIDLPLARTHMNARIVPRSLFLAVRFVALYDEGQAISQCGSEAIDQHLAGFSR